jgi:hypothetical protein
MIDIQEHLFFNIIVNCMLHLNSLQIKLSLDENTLKESNIIKNLALNWLIELLDMIKSIVLKNQNGIDQKQIEFSIKIFIAFIYSWSNQLEFNYNDYKIISFDIEYISENFDQYFIKFLNQSYCKQVKNKIIEWLITIQLVCNLSENYDKILRGIFLKNFNQIYIIDNI